MTKEKIEQSVAGRIKVIVMGAAGRDFHNFNVFYKDNTRYEVVAFTATQIPGIENRTYPSILTGDLYPEGIPIYPETQLKSLIKENNIDLVVFAYSDVSHEYVMHKASEVLASGADFLMLGPNSTMLKSKIPVIAICATRTGAGKSQTVRKIVQILRDKGKRVVSIRHPMPYGDLAKQAVQRFATLEDLDIHNCTVEEREEYQPHIDMGAVIYSGVDYQKILQEAEKEAEIIVWDGGNNDFSFFKSDLYIVVTDPLRVGSELSYHPGETNLRMADIVVINKENSADKDSIIQLKENIKNVNPNCKIVDANSEIYVDNPKIIKGKSVLVIEDGPSLTHGGLSYGAGFKAAEKFGAKEIISPLPFAAGSIKDMYKKFPHIRKILPAMGYSSGQLKELETTINNTPAEVVIIGTPINLDTLIRINKPTVRVRYELEEIIPGQLTNLLSQYF